MPNELSIPQTEASDTARLIGPQLPPADQLSGRQPRETPHQQPMSLEMMELELALDLDAVAERGFSSTVQAAATAIGGEFLFDLPASGLVDDAQRIAVICLSRDDGGRFGLVLLDGDGSRARTVEPDQATADLVQFARAFVAVLEKL